LSDLASIGTDKVETDNALIHRLQAHELSKAGRWHINIILIIAHSRDLLAVNSRVLKRGEFEEISANIITETSHSLLLRKTDSAVLDRSEDGGRNKIPVHELGGATEDALSKELAGLDSHRSELRTVTEDITDGVDVRDIGLLTLVDGELTVGLASHTSLGEVESASVSVTTSGVHDSVEHVGCAIGEGHSELLVLTLGDGSRQLLHELGAGALHDFADLISALAVEAAEEDGAHSDSGVKAERVEHTSAFEGDVGGTHDKGLAGAVVEGEEIIRGDAVLAGTGDVGGDLGATTSSNENVLSSDSLLHTLDCVLDSVLINEGTVCIDVFDLVGAKTVAVAEIEGTDVVLDGLHKVIPVVGNGVAEIPTILLRIVMHHMTKMSSIMHQLLGL